MGNTVISAYCGYQILVTKLCNGGRISYILTNFIPNISALNSKRFTHKLLNNGLPSAGQTTYNTVLNHSSKSPSKFFSALKNGFNIDHFREYMMIVEACICSLPILADNIGKLIFNSRQLHSKACLQSQAVATKLMWFFCCRRSCLNTLS